MAHSVVHFGIYCDDPDRAISFYTGVFGWQFQSWGPPGYWLITAGADGEIGAHVGGLSKRQQPRAEGGPNAYRCTINVADINAICTAIEAHGGEVVGRPMQIPQVGWVPRATSPVSCNTCPAIRSRPDRLNRQTEPQIDHHRNSSHRQGVGQLCAHVVDVVAAG